MLNVYIRILKQIVSIYFFQDTFGYWKTQIKMDFQTPFSWTTYSANTSVNYFDGEFIFGLHFKQDSIVIQLQHLIWTKRINNF